MRTKNNESEAAREAIRELRRLAAEASRRLERGSWAPTASSLAAMAAVIEQALSSVHRASHSAPRHVEESEMPQGMYL